MTEVKLVTESIHFDDIPLVPEKAHISELLEEFFSYKESIDRSQLDQQKVGIYNAYLYLVSFIYENFYKLISENFDKEGFVTYSDIAAALTLFSDTRKKKGQVLLTAAGRSEKAGEFLEEILYHNGLDCKNMTDENVRALGLGDIVWSVSGSGMTTTPVNHFSAALKLSGKLKGEVKTFSITGANPFSASTLSRLADVNIQIMPNPTADMKRRTILNEVIAKLQGEHARLAPQGTIFEISAAALCAALGYALPERVWCCKIPLEFWEKKVKSYIINSELELFSIESSEEEISLCTNRRTIKKIASFVTKHHKIPLQIIPLDDGIDLNLAAQRFMLAVNRMTRMLMDIGENLRTNELLKNLERFVSTVQEYIRNSEELSPFAEVPSVFWLGKGLSGAVARFASIRYNHLQKQKENKSIGLKVKTEKQWPGEENDLAILISGSGTTSQMIDFFLQGKSLGIKIALFTSFADSKLAKVVAKNKGEVFVLKGRTTRESNFGRPRSDTGPPLPAFEIACLCILDAVLAKIADNLQIETGAVHRDKSFE